MILPKADKITISAVTSILGLQVVNGGLVMKKAKQLFLILSFIFLAGCFDIEEKVVIHRDGSGSISMSVISDLEIETSMRDEKLSGVIRPKVQVRNVIKSKKFHHIEAVEFENISDLVLENGRISVEILGQSGRNKNATFAHIITLEDDEPGSEDLFAGHYYSYTVELPGEITTVHPLIIRDIEIEPAVSQNAVTWDIPLNMAIEQEELLLRVDFEAELGFSENLQSLLRHEYVQERLKDESVYKPISVGEAETIVISQKNIPDNVRYQWRIMELPHKSLIVPDFHSKSNSFTFIPDVEGGYGFGCSIYADKEEIDDFEFYFNAQ